MSGPSILSINEQCCYSTSNTPMYRQDHQEWLVDVGGIFLKAAVTDLFNSDNRIPKTHNLYPNSAVPMFCISADWKQDIEAPNIWRVFADWRTISNVQDLVPDPTQRPVIIRTGTYREQRTPNVDLDQKPVATTAGEPIVHAIQQAFPMYTVKKFLKAYPTKVAKQRDYVNSDAVTIYGVSFKPYELYCPEINVSELMTQGNFNYFEFDAVIYANTDKNGWRTRLRNAGYHERKITGYIRNPDIPPGPGNNVFQLPLMIPVYAFEAIVMGKPGATSYPSSPVLLDPNGRAFREKLPTDTEKTGNTGPVIGLAPGTPAVGTAITQEQWDAAVVDLRFVNLVSFNQFFPLK